MTNPRYNPSAKDIKASWFIIDAKGQRLGKVAVKAATILMGKHQPTYVPHLDNGHRLIIINAAELSVEERKLNNKMYYHHTGYPGGIRSKTMAELYDARPEEVVRKAIKGMLPKNRLGSAALGKLYIYAGQEHQQQAQQPEVVEV